jgi:hypothetical protein
MNFSTMKSLTIPEGSVKRILMGGSTIWEKPSVYTEIEYIETAEEQYIDTGFVPDNNSRVVADFALTDDVTPNRIFGCRVSMTDRAFTFAVSGGEWHFGYGSSHSTDVQIDTQRHIADLNKNALSLDGNVLYTAEESEFVGTYSICLGAVKTTRMYLGRVRFYSCQIYDNGTLVRDFVPCISADGEAGMWDKVNNQFYGNAGSGEFVTSE